MIFSKLQKEFKCLNCGFKFVTVAPTSIFPIMSVIVFSGVIWGKIFFNIISHKIISVVIGVILSTILLVLFYFILDFYQKRVSKKCSKCGGELKVLSVAFVSAFIPDFFELLIYILVITIPIVIIKI